MSQPVRQPVPVVLPTPPTSRSAPDLRARADAMLERLRDARTLSREEVGELVALRDGADLDLVSRRMLQGAAVAHDQLNGAYRAEQQRQFDQQREAERERAKREREERWRALPREERWLLVIIERGSREQRAFAEMLLALLREGDAFDERPTPDLFEDSTFRLPTVSRRPL